MSDMKDMSDDRGNVCDVVSEMLDNPNEHGIYPTTKAYDALVALIETARVEALGWMLAEMCRILDNGGDPRKEDIAEMLPRAVEDLS